MPAATAALVAAREAYQELCSQLLDDSDYDSIGGKIVRNKQGWRKLGAAFNISELLLDRIIHRDPGGLVMSAEMVVRAIAPSGRYMDGYGACDVRDRCCERAYGENCTVNRRGHRHCELNCSGRSHFSNPSHDIPSTAMTRAVSRAFEDLFGQGEPRGSVDGSTGEVRGLDTRGSSQSALQVYRQEMMRLVDDDPVILVEEAIDQALGYVKPPAELDLAETRKVVDWLRQPPADS